MASLLNLLMMARERMPDFKVGRCKRNLVNDEDCSECFKICPKGAIELISNGIIINDSCDGCMICLPVCPTNALRSTYLEDKVALQSKDKKKSDILCEMVSGQGIKVPCPASLDMAQLVFLSLFLKHPITIIVKNCEGCPREKAINRLIRNINEIKNHERFVLIVDKNPDEEHIDRKGFFKDIAENILFLVIDKKDETEKSVDYSKKNLLKILNYYGITEYKAFKLLSPELSGNCNFCGLCAANCPQNALNIEFHNKNISLKLNSDICNGCEICTITCPEKSLKMTVDVHPSERFIKELNGNICLICNRPALENETLCTACKNSKKSGQFPLAIIPPRPNYRRKHL